MKAYRSIDIEEAYSLYKTGYIKPREFSGNEHSTCPAGKYSFWFNVPVLFEDPFMVIEADISRYKEYEMTFKIRETLYTDETVTKQYKIPEFVTDLSVKPSKIYFNSILDYLFEDEFYIIDTTSYEDYEDFIKWCQSVIIIPDDDIIHRNMFISVRDYGRRYQHIKGRCPCAFRNTKIWLFEKYYRTDKSYTALYNWR